MKLIIFLLTLSLSLSLSKKKLHETKHHHSTSSESTDERPLSSEEYIKRYHRKVSRSTDKHRYFSCKGILRQTFAIELAFQHCGASAVCSPVSALLPLAKLILGAEGKTREELTDAIGLYKKKTVNESFTVLIKNLQHVSGVTLNVASRIYVGEEVEILPKFSEAATSIFNSAVEKLSFKQPKQAADEINGWVSRQTNGMIPLLLQPTDIDPNTSLVIVNAVYFKGKWLNPFNQPYVGDFFSPTGPKKTQLMSNVSTCRYTKSDVLNSEIVEIPYEGDTAKFLIVLPIEKAGLTLLLNQLKLAPNLLNTALKKLKPERVDLTIPKFSITTSFDLKKMYEKIGVKQMTKHSESGLKNIVKGQELTVSAAIQKAVIDVHERGTEASAASAVVGLGLSSNAPKSITVTADHPFLFYVQVHAEQLFAGIYSDP